MPREKKNEIEETHQRAAANKNAICQGEKRSRD